MYSENDSVAIRQHQPCDECGSSDAKTYYSDGGTHCFSCNTTTKDRSGTQQQYPQRQTMEQDLINNIESTDLVKRKIPETICRQYRYGTSTDKSGNLCQVANYYNKDRELVAQKLRYPNKDFRFIGNSKEALLFGQQLWSSGGKKLVITEGEIDALSVATAFDGKYPVVSIKGGATSAKKEVSNNLEWIASFEEVYIWFDNDEPGKKAVEDCVNLIPADKIRIIRHTDYKDANEVLVYTGKAGIVNSLN